MSGPSPYDDGLKLVEAFASTGSADDLIALRNWSEQIKIPKKFNFFAFLISAVSIAKGKTGVDTKAIIDVLKAVPTLQATLVHQGDNINSEANHMRDQFNNSGQAGAVGPNAKVSGNVFVQQIAADLQKTPVSPADLAILEKLIDMLPQHTTDKFTKSFAIQAAGELMKVKDALQGNDENEKVSAISSWRKWIGDKGDDVASAIGVVANVVTIAAPFAALLGFPVG